VAFSDDKKHLDVQNNKADELPNFAGTQEQHPFPRFHNRKKVIVI